MIETKVPMDVRTYKAKLIGPFTTRQLICVSAAVCLDALLFFGVIHPLGLPIRLAVFGLVFVDFPIIAFIAEPMGMPMEKYLKNVLWKNLITPTKERRNPRFPNLKRRPIRQKSRSSQKIKWPSL